MRLPSYTLLTGSTVLGVPSEPVLVTPGEGASTALIHSLDVAIMLDSSSQIVESVKSERVVPKFNRRQRYRRSGPLRATIVTLRGLTPDIMSFPTIRAIC